MRGVLIALVLAGCSTNNNDVVGPFTGTTHRYVIDGIQLPRSNADARELGDDLDGDRAIDNQLGMVISTLHYQGVLTEHGPDMISGGAIASSLEIVADDLDHDETVGVRYLGGQDSPYVEVGGRMTDGQFRSNRTALTQVAGEADLHLPVFDEANPSLVHVIGLELDLDLEPDGAGAYNASIHGAVPTDEALSRAVYQGVIQTIASNPGEHRALVKLLDADRDGVVSYTEVTTNSLLISLLAGDVMIDGRAAISIGFRAHFRPCDSGSCPDSTPFDACFDRLRDGDETDVDCGGSCRGCEADATCVTGSDCETTTCEEGRCGPPSCTNGSHDGLESDVDCGANCAPCAIGQRCYFDGECASGVCGAPCLDPQGCWDLGITAYTCSPRP